MQQHVISMVVERFPYLTLKHGFKNNYFDFNRSVSCPLCNKNHKKEIIRNYSVFGVVVNIVAKKLIVSIVI